MATAAAAAAAASSSPGANRAASHHWHCLSRSIPSSGAAHCTHYGHRDPRGGDHPVPAPDFPCPGSIPAPGPCGHTPGLPPSLCDQHPKATGPASPVKGTKCECHFPFTFVVGWWIYLSFLLEKQHNHKKQKSDTSMIQPVKFPWQYL